MCSRIPAFLLAIVTLTLVAVTLSGFAMVWPTATAEPPQPATTTRQLQTSHASSLATFQGEAIQYPREAWEAASLKVAPAEKTSFTDTVELTGKIALNEDRVAHLHPLVEGVVDSVHVHLGQRIKKGELLAVIQSREVGQAKLALYQARLHHAYTVAKHERSQEVAKNTSELITALRKHTPIEAIEEMFRDRPMGEYRQQLLSAYVSLYKSNIDFERLESLSAKGAIAGKQIITAKAARNADRATLQAWLEQIDHDLKNAALLSSQAVREAETQVAVAETNLKILGYEANELATIDPAKEGESIAHYPIRAPFDGTVISKDVVFLERAEPSKQILSVADLSTVWVTADVYEVHLRLLSRLNGKKLTVRSAAWPDRTFEAEIFYTGELMDESSRTIPMRAVADNREGLLKPGMFVNIQLPSDEGVDVLQVPASAIQEHEGQTFVFVQSAGDAFLRRDVRIGRTSETGVEILSGIRAGDPIVIDGGFVLKSRMLAELMEGD